MAWAMRELELWHGPRVEDNNKYDIILHVMLSLRTSLVNSLLLAVIAVL